MTRTARTLMALAAALALVAAVAGCGTKEPAKKVSSETPAPAIKTIKLGLAAPLTGDNAVYGQGMKRAVELAIVEANSSEAAQQAGIVFDEHAEDDAGDPRQAVSVANILVSDTDVIALVGHFNSICSLPAAPVYNEAGMAMVTLSSDSRLTAQGYKVVDRIVAKDDAQGRYAGKLASDLGYKEVALIDDATSYGKNLASQFKKAFTAAGGSIVSTVRIQPKDADFSALVTKIKGESPDVVYYAGADTEGARLSKQMGKAGLKVPVMGGDKLLSPEYIQTAGAASATGDIATSLGLPLAQQPKGEDFRTRYHAMYTKDPEAYESYAYDAAWAIIDAVIKSGATADRATIAEAIRAGSIDGVTGTVAFDKNGDNKQQVISAYRVADEQWVQVKR